MSRITNRKGYIENLPQLSGAEFGWGIDQRRLFIGNGRIEDGAPVLGNTEVLTEFSDVLALSDAYTYKGLQAGYIVNTGPNGSEIKRSLQEKFDETVSILDFGAIGDGVFDNTETINRALYELFCRDTNHRIRRALYFPAGIYRISDTIKVPPYAKIFGDGIDSSVIKYYSPGNDLIGDPIVATQVIDTSDRLQRIGLNLRLENSVDKITGISISDMSIISTEDNNILRINSLTNSYFTSIKLGREISRIDLDLLAIGSAIKIINNGNLEVSNITFDKFETIGTGTGILIEDTLCKGIRFQNGKLTVHKIGVNLKGNDVTGVNISGTMFDDIARFGIIFDGVSMCSSTFNSYYNVGNLFTSPAVPSSAVINILSDNNISFGDLFERTDEEALTEPRVRLNSNTGIAFDSSSAMLLGSYERRIGLEAVIPNGNPKIEVFTLMSKKASKFKIDYTISRNNDVRMGDITISNNLSSNIHYSDEYTQSINMNNVIIDVELAQDIVNNPIGTTVSLTPDASGGDVTFKYSIVRLD